MSAETISLRTPALRSGTWTLCNFAVPVSWGEAKPLPGTTQLPAKRRSSWAEPLILEAMAGSPAMRAARRAFAISVSPVMEKL